MTGPAECYGVLRVESRSGVVPRMDMSALEPVRTLAFLDPFPVGYANPVPFADHPRESSVSFPLVVALGGFLFLRHPSSCVA